MTFHQVLTDLGVNYQFLQRVSEGSDPLPVVSAELPAESASDDGPEELEGSDDRQKPFWNTGS